ncbi:MAG: hypothetical protein ACE5JL_12570 [Dehalococcoidia bacterium]
MFTALRKLLIFIFVFLLALTFIPIVRAQGPDPAIMAIVIPSTIEEPGQSFEVTVQAANYGGEAKGAISLSFPDNPAVQIVDHDATGQGESATVHRPGDSITKFPTLEKMTAQYPLAETWYPRWSEGEIHFLTVRITPSATASVTRVYIRVALADEAGRFYLAPAESTVSDQQGFPVEVREVRVAPTPTPTPIPPTATRIPTSTAIPPTATSIPTPTAILPTATFIPTATSMPPTATSIPRPTAILPTAAPIPTPTPIPPATRAIDPVMATIIIAAIGAISAIAVALIQSRKGKES